MQNPRGQRRHRQQHTLRDGRTRGRKEQEVQEEGHIKAKAQVPSQQEGEACMPQALQRQGRKGREIEKDMPEQEVRSRLLPRSAQGQIDMWKVPHTHR